MIGWHLRTAVLATIAASVIAVVTGVRAVRLESVPIASLVIETPRATHPDVHRRAATGSEVLAAAAEHNLFHPQRRRGGVFRPEGEEPIESAYDGGDYHNAENLVRLVGTAVSHDGEDFVVCAVGPDPHKIVRLGEWCGDLLLDAVKRGRAEFTDPAGERVMMEVPNVGTP